MDVRNESSYNIDICAPRLVGIQSGVNKPNETGVDLNAYRALSLFTVVANCKERGKRETPTSLLTPSRYGRNDDHHFRKMEESRTFYGKIEASCFIFAFISAYVCTYVFSPIYVYVIADRLYTYLCSSQTDGAVKFSPHERRRRVIRAGERERNTYIQGERLVAFRKQIRLNRRSFIR